MRKVILGLASASLLVASPARADSEINAAYIEGFLAAQSRRELKPVVEQLFADTGLVNRQLLDDLLRYKRLDGVPELLGALAERLFAGGRQRELPVLDLTGRTLPLTVVWGEHDRIIPTEHAQRAPAGSRVHVLPGAGHMAMMEKAADFNSVLRGHLAEC